MNLAPEASPDSRMAVKRVGLGWRKVEWLQWGREVTHARFIIRVIRRLSLLWFIAAGFGRCI